MTSATAANVHHVGVDLELDRAGEPRDREAGDDEADRDEKARLGERGEVLRLRRARRDGRGRQA